MDSDFLSKPESRKDIANAVQTKKELNPENYLYDSEEECNQIYPELIGIDDIDEDFLSELYAVGDFHVEDNDSEEDSQVAWRSLTKIFLLSSAGQFSPVSQDRAGSSDFHSFSESLKSRMNAVSMRYKESITKSTRGWRDRLFSRNSVISDFGSEVKREVNAGIATVSRMMDRLETRDSVGPSTASTPLSSQIHSAREASNDRVTLNNTALLNNASPSASCAASSAPK